MCFGALPVFVHRAPVLHERRHFHESPVPTRMEAHRGSRWDHDGVIGHQFFHLACSAVIRWNGWRSSVEPSFPSRSCASNEESPHGLETPEHEC